MIHPALGVWTDAHTAYVIFAVIITTIVGIKEGVMTAIGAVILFVAMWYVGVLALILIMSMRVGYGYPL